jgi:hypothetical protein
MAAYTEAYRKAEEIRPKAKPIDVNDIMKYHGIGMIRALYKLPRYRMYWADLDSPFQSHVGQIMSVNRYIFV